MYLALFFIPGDIHSSVGEVPVFKTALVKSVGESGQYVQLLSFHSEQHFLNCAHRTRNAVKLNGRERYTAIFSLLTVVVAESKKIVQCCVFYQTVQCIYCTLTSAQP